MEAWCHQKASEVVLVCVKCIRKPYYKPHKLAGSGKDSTVWVPFVCRMPPWKYMESYGMVAQLQTAAAASA
jgi:hypothetical protein